MGLRVIVTGTTGMVGEGVLLECLANPAVDKVLALSRRGSGHTHEKLSECLVADFLELGDVESQLTGYDACFYCAGVSSVGMSEADYTRITYDTAVHFAEVLARRNPGMVFCHVSGASTDSTEQGKVMWARVKGRAENAVLKLPFKHAHNFRPGLMTPVPGQQHVKTLYRVLLTPMPLWRLVFRGKIISLSELGRAMIHAVGASDAAKVLEVADIKALAATSI
jgi:uncharacterized protein YbjT (DUF2867 family)